MALGQNNLSVFSRRVTIVAGQDTEHRDGDRCGVLLAVIVFNRVSEGACGGSRSLHIIRREGDGTGLCIERDRAVNRIIDSDNFQPCPTIVTEQFARRQCDWVSLQGRVGIIDGHRLHIHGHSGSGDIAIRVGHRIGEGIVTAEARIRRIGDGVAVERHAAMASRTDSGDVQRVIAGVIRNQARLGQCERCNLLGDRRVVIGLDAEEIDCD